MRSIGIFFCGLIGFIVVVGAIVGIYWMTTNNREISLRNGIVAQKKSTEAVYDTMWKIIQQQAQVADKYQDSFRKTFKDIIAGRYDNDHGKFMSMITEANPNFDSSLFSKLMTSIEGQRTNFLREQKQLIDLKQEHDNIIDQTPSSWVVGSRPKVEIVVVTSTRTDNTFRSGKDDDVNVFPK